MTTTISDAASAAPALGTAVVIPLLLTGLLTVSACAEERAQTDGAATRFDLSVGRYPLEALVQFKLPKRLKEISGLTLDDNGRLFAHDDERGIVYALDFVEGAIAKTFALQGGVRADFEGIAFSDGRFFLLVSNGTLYRFEEGDDGATVAWERFDARLPCEVEGLTADEEGLWVACKNLDERKPGEGIRIYRWRFADETYAAEETLSVPRKPLLAALRGVAGYAGKKLQPTALTTLGDDHLLVLAGRQHALVEISKTGTVSRGARLPEPARHAQPEGIAVTSDARLIIADEGDGRGNTKKRGRLSVYHPAR